MKNTPKPLNGHSQSPPPLPHRVANVLSTDLRLQRPQTVPSGIVLVVSEFNDDLVLLADMLMRAHRRILWQTSCRDAMRSLSGRNVDVVLCARTLADGDWRRILDALTRLPQPPPLVVVSPDEDPQLRAEAVMLGAASCVSLKKARQAVAV